MNNRDRCPEVLDHYESFFQGVMLPNIFESLGVPSHLLQDRPTNHSSETARRALCEPAANRSLPDMDRELLDW